MADADYDAARAATYRTSREVSREGLDGWRAAVARELPDDPAGLTLLDIGAGTGVFATAFADWFGVHVVAVEPSAAMRATIPEHPGVEPVAGDAQRLPVPDDTADAAWLSTMIHHIPDLAGAATEIRRALRPQAPVLIRQPFPERTTAITHLRFFPETARLLNTYPTVEQTRRAFLAAGFRSMSLRPVPQETAPSLAALAAVLDDARATDTLLRSITDDEYRAGCERLHAAVRVEADRGTPEPVVDHLDLLVLR